MTKQRFAVPPKLPQDLTRALSRSKEIKAIFDKLPNSHKSKYVSWIDSAKRPETRSRRIEKAMTMVKARKEEKLPTGTIEQTHFIPAKPEEVYQAFMDAKKHTEFTGSKATGSSRVGERFTAWDGYITARNLELQSGRKIVQEWKTTEWPPKYPPSMLQFTFQEKNGGTEVKMIHSRVPAKQVKKYDEGWVTAYWEP